jgi:dTDP-4-amino-4,6-dideoxygalactose transaminase
MMIPFNRPAVIGNEIEYIKQVLNNGKLCGDGIYTQKCNQWFEQKFSCKKALLTTSGTHALDMAAILCDIQPGDEVILPSYTFVSTANAFVLRGAKVVFVDIRPDTMNIDEKLIEKAINCKTKVIVVVHYAGIACQMDAIMKIARKHNLLVVEDAAQGVMAKYKDKYLGTIGDIGCYSFHETKNYTCGEGGAILLNNEKFIERAEIIREKGTNRSKFYRGEVDKYTWMDIGSSYLPSELNAAYLYAQLEQAEVINENRLKSWNYYNNHLFPLAKQGFLELPFIPDDCQHNGHMFYVKFKDLEERTAAIDYLKHVGIYTVFHYIPLHSTSFAKKHGCFCGADQWTTQESERLLRLPLYYNIGDANLELIVEKLKTFFIGKLSAERYVANSSMG